MSSLLIVKRFELHMDLTLYKIKILLLLLLLFYVVGPILVFAPGHGPSISTDIRSLIPINDQYSFTHSGVLCLRNVTAF